MPESAKAVFLSYAREDADAARRIADALRAFGVEVWFDQNELRGGDAWDTKIKTQIRECALFVPVISERTQARAEGYFRREWRQAVERTHDMAHGHAFIIPVVVDATPENEALVPEEFMRVQWTRLPNGVPTPDFVGQVKRLLESPREPARVSRPSPPHTSASPFPASAATGSAEPTIPASRRSVPLWIGLGALAVALVVGGILILRKPASLAMPQVASKPESPTPAPAAAAEDKSVAVLPFENMSADKSNTFFCDGVQEDILTNLGNIRALRVVSRTSVEKYRNTTLSVRDIARELGVAYILEGSVQREGNRVRVTGQLIHAVTDEHVWAKAYDRDLIDVFSIQSELAQAIATALQMAITPEEKTALNRKQTTNPAAYDLYLEARQTQERSVTTIASVDRRIDLLERAVKLDASFAAAWGELADAHAFSAFWGFEGSATHLERAKVAIDQATALAPDDPDVIQDLGTYYYYGLRDYARASEQYNRLAQLRPNDAREYNSLGLIGRRQGRWAESLANSRRAVELDPSNLGYLRNLDSTLEMGNRWDEAIAVQQRIVALEPDNLRDQEQLYSLELEATGSSAAGDAFFAALPKDRADSPLGLAVRADWALETGRYDEALAIWRRQPFFEGEGAPHYMQAFAQALTLAAVGDRTAAIKTLGAYPDELRTKMAADPGVENYRLFLASMEALLGHRDAAIRIVDQVVAEMPESRDAIDGPLFAMYGMSARAWAGDVATAVAALPKLLRTPNGLKVAALRSAPNWAPLRSDPRVKALIDDPKNNEPLF